MNFKISLLKISLLKLINANEFNDRYAHLVKYYNSIKLVGKVER